MADAVVTEMASPSRGSRARRATSRRVNYAKEQEFSDEDVFEDEDLEEKAPPKRKVGGRTRKKSVSAPAASPSALSGPSSALMTAAAVPLISTPTAAPATSATMIPSMPVAAMEIDDQENVIRKPVFTEKGYDPNLPPIRERFPFMPEYEEDGSPKIELIIGRRLLEDTNVEEDEESEENKAGKKKASVATDEDAADEENDNEATPAKGGRGRGRKKKAAKAEPSPEKKDASAAQGPVEYEYLVKYKGRSYLHLEWKTGADLESMNKSAKGIYRRYIKKIAACTEDDIENPEFDPSFIVPERILAEEEQEIMVELSDKELLRWEKQREKELAEEGESEDEKEKEKEEEKKTESDEEKKEEKDTTDANEPQAESQEAAEDEDWSDGEIDYSKVTIEKLRVVLKKDGPYYPVVEGSSNPYRDGFVTEPPKKPRASYLFFQCSMRSYYQKKNPNAVQSELMTILGEAWRTLSEEERAPYLFLAQEEASQFEKERAMLEKAQKPNEVWQPIRRCWYVLDRLTKDSFADIFMEPVNTNEFTDYLELIDHPMDLGTVRLKLETKKYQVAEQFARDMRRVWNNCKIYNQHGSAIWHVADYMSKQFERLYHAWVLDFRERYLRWANPRARPWEHSCRQHDGKCETPDDQMVLCDFCDAMYGIQCIDPPMKKPPKKAWHCPDCKPKLKSAKAIRMLSAVAENAARKRAELGDLPKKRIKQLMYLVKWAGLGYENCTWETRDDIKDDKLIQKYHRLNNTFPDESDMSQEVLENFFEETKHINKENAGGIHCIPALRAQLYAQSRAFEFIKFGLDVPGNVCSECGPATRACVTPDAPVLSSDQSPVVPRRHPREVVECLADLIFKIERSQPINPVRSNTSLPPPMTGEYDTVIPITSKGLMMNVGEIHGSVSFLGYRSFPDGSKGPAELRNLIRNVGDKIIAVDGISTIGKTFREVIDILRESGKNKFAYMRFLENRYSVCEGHLASVGPTGRYAIEELRKKFTSDRQKLIVQRKQQLLKDEVNKKVEESDDEEARPDNEESDGSSTGSEGDFQPDSDDEDLGDVEQLAPPPDALLDDAPDSEPNNVANQDQKPEENNAAPLAPDGSQVVVANPETTIAQPVTVDGTEVNGGNDDQLNEAEVPQEAVPGVIYRQETTRSLAFRLLDVDLGYSSDEGGDDDAVYHLDGVDRTFTTMDELAAIAEELPKKINKNGKEVVPEDILPARQNEFSTQGERGKLATAVALTTKKPNMEDFDNFPYPSTKELEAAERKREALEAASPTKGKRSTVKVEQVSLVTGEVLHVWANVESAAATLQLRLDQLRQVLRGEYDEDIGDEVGGYKWRYALAGAKVTAGTGSTTRGGAGKKAKEAWLEFRDKLYNPAEPHNYKNNNRLRDYQVDGVNWLASTFYRRSGCILADEMGLGKTVQIVCYIEHLYRVEKIRRPYLVVVPLSTVEHWRREFEGWTDMVCCVYHDRQRVWRDVLREYEWYYEDRPHTPDFLKFDVLVTTYDTLIGDFDVVSQIPFRVTVVDEAHRLRNQKGKLLECMREISAKGTMHYGYQSRVLMSGTPLQNDLTELWTLLNFIEPYKFQDLEDFQDNYGNMANREQVESLQRQISPFMLRRVKEDVAKDIPAKEETLIDVELTSIQKQYYRAIFEHNHAFLSIGATRQTAPKLMNIQMELRKVCNHPFLLDGVEHRENERMYKEFVENGKFEGKPPEDQQHMLNEHGYIMMSGKMVLLDKLLPKLRQEGHKVLIFSQMVKMLDLISEYCEFRHFRYERLDGRVRGTDRQKAIDRFEREADSFVFLLSTRAGGVGINLTAADICIIFDSDWNPQNDVQAQARCHRIGQTKDVRIYRLITSRSFEQEMFDRASKKLGLEQAVLGTFEKDKEDDKPTHQEMEQLLKRGAYALLEDENDQITKEFCADDIENILAKRTRTRVVEGAKTATWLNKQGMCVSKSKFSAEGGQQLDMDDPLFWQKVMPDFVTPAILMQKLNELQDEVEGKKKKGPGRGRGRWKKKAAEEAEKEKLSQEAGAEGGADDANGTGNTDENSQLKPKECDVEDSLLADETLEDMSDEENVVDGKGSKKQLTRTQVRKIHKFINDVKSMMETLLEEAEDEPINAGDKDICQKMLFTISVKENIFNEEQRHIARVYLKRLEGDRKRRCRTSEQPRFRPGPEDEAPTPAHPDLMIRGKKRRKRRKRGEIDDDLGLEEPIPKQRRKRRSDAIEDGGYLHHSDSEADWSDVDDDIYGAGGKKREQISRKEARRRRTWGQDDDAATAAGRPWPVFPRHVVKKVLRTLLEEVVKYDKEQGGVFSVPVPKDEFPEYYEQIKIPMDYGTMTEKLENGEYRSAQAMQKDFILILQNCRQFNASTSEIVKEAREQHLIRPKILKEAAMKHDLFLAEDGTVLEIFDEGKKGTPPRKGKNRDNLPGDDEPQPELEPEPDEDLNIEKIVEPKKRKKRKKKSLDSDQEDIEPTPEVVVAVLPVKKTRKFKKKNMQPVTDGTVGVKEDNSLAEDNKERPRIKIKLKGESEGEGAVAGKKVKKKFLKRKRLQEEIEDEDVGVTVDAEVDATPIPRKKRAKKEKDLPMKKNKEAPPPTVNVENVHGNKESSELYLDLSRWKEEREVLDGSFASAREMFTKHGPWVLPDRIPDKKFPDVAKHTLMKMDRHDKFSVFSKAVTDDDAPNYSEIVKNPMDFGTMRAKVEKGSYGVGSSAAAALYADFLLVFDNCHLYNDDDSDVTNEAARILTLLPEAYVHACITVVKRLK